jgi:hypothetical protein
LHECQAKEIISRHLRCTYDDEDAAFLTRAERPWHSEQAHTDRVTAGVVSCMQSPNEQRMVWIDVVRMDEVIADMRRPLPGPVFFLHISKTAGTSLRQYISSHFDPDETFPFYLLGEIQHATPPVRRNFAYYEGHFSYDFMRWVHGADLNTLTMLREPMEQVLSLYSFLPTASARVPSLIPDEDNEIERMRTMSVDEYFRRTKDDVPFFFTNMQTQYIASKRIFAHAPWISEAFEKALPPYRPEELEPDLAEAKRRLSRFAFVGLTERFRDSIALLSYTFGWMPVQEVRVRRITENRVRADQLDLRTVARIREHNEKDFSLYAHARQLFDGRYRAMIEDLGQQFSRRIPLAEGELDELLDLYYEERFAEEHPPERSLHIDFTRPIEGWGWHDIERSMRGGRVRWTGPGTNASIDLPITQDRDIRIAIRVVAALAPDILESVRLLVNEVSVALDGEPDVAGGIIFTGVVPREVLMRRKSFARVTIATTRTVRPVDLNPASGDDRALGVLVNWIDLGPQ